MSAKKRILEQDLDFERVLAEEYRRAAGVADSFAADIMKLNRVSTPTPSRKAASSSTRRLARRLLLKK